MISNVLHWAGTFRCNFNTQIGFFSCLEVFIEVESHFFCTITSKCVQNVRKFCPRMSVNVVRPKPNDIFVITKNVVSSCTVTLQPTHVLAGLNVTNIVG